MSRVPFVIWCELQGAVADPRRLASPYRRFRIQAGLDIDLSRLVGSEFNSKSNANAASSLYTPLIVLTKRIQPETIPDGQLPLTADQRSVVRARRSTACGRDVLLQLPRDGALRPGDVLADDLESVRIQVIAASEPLLHVSADHPLELLKAAYHLGNRHIALELKENDLWLQDDAVLRSMLEQRGLSVEPCVRAFEPERGAYGGHHHS